MNSLDTLVFAEGDEKGKKVDVPQPNKLRNLLRASLAVAAAGLICAGCGNSKYLEKEPVRKSSAQLDNSPEWDVATQTIREQLTRFCSLKLMVYEYTESRKDPLIVKDAIKDRDKVFLEIEQSFINAEKLIQKQENKIQIEKYRKVFKTIQGLKTKNDTAKLADKLGDEYYENL